jgi:hypothetical protein
MVAIPPFLRSGQLLSPQPDLAVQLARLSAAGKLSGTSDGPELTPWREFRPINRNFQLGKSAGDRGPRLRSPVSGSQGAAELPPPGVATEKL